MKDLRSLCEASGLTQFQLATRSGVSRMRLSLAECGDVVLTGEEERRVRECVLGAVREQSSKLKMILSEVTAA